MSGQYDASVNCNLYKANNVKIFLYNCKEIFFGESCFLCKKDVFMKGFYLTPIFSIKHIHIYQFFGNENNVMCYSCKSKYKAVRNESPEPIAIKTNLLHPNNTELLVRSIPISEELFYERFREIYNNMYRTISYLNYYFENKLQEIQMVKDTMVRIMKTPLLTKELEECMDEILDLNGNRISQLKEYLTEEQQDMLNRMNKMLKQLKMTSVGQSVMDLPIARPITPEIKHLERELESHKFRQKKHEKDLEKLKCKI